MSNASLGSKPQRSLEENIDEKVLHHGGSETGTIVGYSAAEEKRLLRKIDLKVRSLSYSILFLSVALPLMHKLTLENFPSARAFPQVSKAARRAVFAGSLHPLIVSLPDPTRSVPAPTTVYCTSSPSWTESTLDKPAVSSQLRAGRVARRRRTRTRETDPLVLHSGWS